MTFHGSAGRAASAVLAMWLAGAPAAAEDRAADHGLTAVEQAVIAHPEDLRVSAAYRQRIIAVEDYDRAIRLFERLSARASTGPNVHISLALAYVDKVPAASPFRRIFLGRDAMRELSRAIEREPGLVAFYIRWLIALYYPEAVFHRARGGIADLERARSLLVALPVQPYHARVYVSLGDGYWKVHDLARAAATWAEGLRRFPTDQALLIRLSNRGPDLDRLVEHVLDPATRVDTSLRELFAAAPSS